MSITHILLLSKLLNSHLMEGQFSYVDGTFETRPQVCAIGDRVNPDDSKNSTVTSPRWQQLNSIIRVVFSAFLFPFSFFLREFSNELSASSTSSFSSPLLDAFPLIAFTVDRSLSVSDDFFYCPFLTLLSYLCRNPKLPFDHHRVE